MMCCSDATLVRDQPIDLDMEQADELQKKYSWHDFNFEKLTLKEITTFDNHQFYYRLYQ